MRRAPAPADAAPPGGFRDAWHQLIGAWTPPVPHGPGRPPRVSVGDLLSALTFHVLQPRGTLSQHFAQLFGARLADSSWAERRQRLPWDVFADLMQRVLRPRAHRRRHPDAFWRGWRLMALDGTQFSLVNTPAILAQGRKARTRRGAAAFVKMTVAVLLEVGWHNPTSAAIARAGESEWALAQRLLATLPRRALLLADRLYGCPVFVAAVIATCARVGSHFLIRARRDITRTVVKRYADGSRLVRVPLRDRRNPNKITRYLALREIRVRVTRRGHRPT